MNRLVDAAVLSRNAPVPTATSFEFLSFYHFHPDFSVPESSPIECESWCKAVSNTFEVFGDGGITRAIHLSRRLPRGSSSL